MMLEAMLSGMRSGVKTEGNTIFLLNDFNTVADIVDKGPLKIPVTKGSTVTVGQDSRGTYMNFPGGTWNSVVNFGSSLLNCNEMELNILIADIPQFNTTYGSLIFDQRPAGQNGNFAIFSVDNSNNTTQRKAFTSIANTGYYGTTKWGVNDLLDVKIKYYSTKTELWINGKLEMSTPVHLNGVNNVNSGLGRHAFSGVAGVNPLQAKIFKFELRKIS